MKRMQVFLLSLFLARMQQIVLVEYSGPFVAEEVGQVQREP